jgi:MFS family permease
MPKKPISPWWTVFAGSCACAVGAGIVAVYTWGIFSRAIAAEFDWDRSTLSLCLTSFLIATGFGTISLGYAIARYGVRRATMTFVSVFSLSLALIPALPPAPWAFYAVFAIMGFAGSAATAMPYAVAITGWFDRHRGLALGLVVLGSGFGATFAPQAVTKMIAAYGWHQSLIIVACTTALIPLVGNLLAVREPVAPASVSGRREVRTAGWGAYLLSREFWLIATPIVGVSAATFGLLGSMVSLLADRGASTAMAAEVLSIAGIGSWIGRVAVGYALDKIFAPHLTAGVLGIVLVGLVLIAVGGTGAWVGLGAALLGLGMGSESDIVAYLIGRYFRFEVYSKALGAMWVAWAWGGGIGNFVASLVFRSTHSYDATLALFGIVLAISVVVILRLGPYAYPPVNAAASEGANGRVGYKSLKAR